MRYIKIPVGSCVDICGNRYGRWKVLYRAENNKYNVTYWACECECGVIKSVTGSSLKSGKSLGCRSCSLTCVLRARARVRTGRSVTSSGYIFLRSEGHPKATRSGQYILEHVLVMEQSLRRYLVKGENIHHKNGIRNDNRIENLELWSTSQPCGQRVIDKIKWAEEILETYKELRK